MSQLLIHPYLDEDVSVLVAQLLRARGFAATTTVRQVSAKRMTRIN